MPVLEVFFGMLGEAVAGQALGSAAEATGRSERYQRILQKLGIDPGRPPGDFESCYVAALVEFDGDRPNSVLQLLRHPEIRAAFEEAFAAGRSQVLTEEVERFRDWSVVGDQLRDEGVDVPRVLAEFTQCFSRVVGRSRSPSEMRRDLKIDAIYKAVVPTQEAPRSATTALKASPDSLARAAAWLEERFPRPGSRRLLLQDQRIHQDANRAWPEIVAELDLERLDRLLRSAGEDTDEADELIARIHREATLTSGDPLERRFQQALEQVAAALSAARFEDALHQTDSLLVLCADGIPRVRSRALLHRVAALHALGRPDEAAAHLGDIEPEYLGGGGRENLARLLVAAGDWARAHDIAPSSEIVRQLIAMRRHDRVPDEDLEHDPDVHGWAAALRIREGRVADGLGLVLPWLDHPGLSPPGSQQLAMTVAWGLHRWWLGESTQVVPDPGRVLAALSDLARRHPDWARIDLALRTLELCAHHDEHHDGGDDDAPTWARILDGEPSRGQLEELVRSHASVGPFLYVLAQARAAEGDNDGAIDAARRAFGILPGRGQLLLLCEMLLLGSRHDEARTMASMLVPDDDRSWWVHAHTADSPTEQLGRARRWTAAHTTSAAAWETLVQLLIRTAHIDQARQAARRALDQVPSAPFTLLRICAIAATNGVEADRALGHRIVQRLRQEHPHNVDAEALRMQLLVGIGRPANEEPPDWERLVETGKVISVSLQEAVEVFQARMRAAAEMDRAWNAGLIGYETWAWTRGIDVGTSALAIQRGELSIPVPIPTEGTTGWRGRRCVLGELAVECLAALDLLSDFGEHVSEVVLFNDVWERLLTGPSRSFAENWRAERDHLDRLWLPVASLPTMEEENLTAAGAAAATEWLSTGGDASWRPGAGPVVLGFDALVTLEHHLEAFVAACADRQIAVAVSRAASDHRHARLMELMLRGEALRLAAVMAEWVGTLDEQGKLQVVAVPEPPLLPPPRGAGTVAWAGRSWATRELLVDDPELWLVTAEFSEIGHDGAAAAAVLIGHSWVRSELRAHLRRYAGLGDRSSSVAAVARQIAPPDRRTEVIGMLANAGFVDSYTGPEVVGLFERHGDLVGSSIARRLDGLVRWSGHRDSHPHHHLLAVHLGPRLFIEAFQHLWFGDEPHPEAGRATRSLLDLAARLDRRSHWRLGVLTLALRALAIGCLRTPGVFLERRVGDELQFGMSSSGGRMWDELLAWTAADRSRVAALHQALAAAWREVSAEPEASLELIGGLYINLLAGLPHAPGLTDLSGAAWAEALAHPVLQEQLDRFRLDGHSLGAWLRSARSSPPYEMQELDLVGRASVGDVEPRRVRFPLEWILLAPQPDAEVVSEMSAHLWALDHRLAAEAQRWLAERTPDSRARLVRAIGRSPVRALAVRARGLLSWSRWNPADTAGLRSLEELRAVLGDGVPHANLEELRSRLEGASAVGTPPLLRQLGRIPGDTVTVGWQTISVEDTDIRGFLRMVDQPQQYASGTIVDAMVALAIAAGSESDHQIGDRTVALDHMAAELTVAALAPRASGEQEIADIEPHLVRTCGQVVLALGDALDPTEWIKDSYLLFAWLLEVCSDLDELRLVADAAPPPGQPEDLLPDLYDPRRAAPGRLDLRELMIVQGLGTLWAARNSEPHPRFDWAHVLPTLAQIATRAYTEDERDLRERWTDTALGGDLLVAPDAARQLLIAMDQAHFLFAPVETRLRWIEDAGRARGGPDLQSNRAVVLMAAAIQQTELSQPERDLLVEALTTMELRPDDLGHQTAVLAAYAIPDAPLTERAVELLTPGLHTQHGPLLASLWMEGCGARDDLDAGVAQLRQLLQAQATDEVPFLLGLFRVAVGPHGAAAQETINRLSVEPHLQEAFAERLDVLGRPGEE